jgi:hypothetical protein
MLSYPSLDQETEDLLLRALAMADSPPAGCVAYKTAAQSHLLRPETRLELYKQAAAFAARIADEGLRKVHEREIASYVARLSGDDSEPGVAYPDRLKKAKDRDKELAKIVAEIRKGTSSVASAAAALVPIADEIWTNNAFHQLVELANIHKDEETLRHGLSGLLRSLEDSAPKEIETRILDTLSLAILSFDKPADRSRYLARFAVLLFVKGRPMEASQRISLAAANAFSVADTAARGEALLHLAGMVAATGALGRARDLSFHAIELRSKVGDLDRESRQLVRLLSTSTAKNDSAEEIVRLGESLRFDNSPMEMEAKGRALVALAAGLARLGAEGQARTYREKAIDTTRAIENIELRIHLLCDLAGALHQSGEKRQARKLAKEARALYDETEEGRGLQSATGLLRVSMVLENRAQTKKCFDLCLKYLKAHPLPRWLGAPALLDLLPLSRHLARTEELMPYLESARQAPDLSDEQLLGLLRCELELGEYGRAEALLDRMSSLLAQCQGGIDLSLASLQADPERALQHLAKIPLELARCEGIRRLALLNSSEIRPTEQYRVRHVLNKLTLMAIDHPDAMDSVLSRWIQGCPDRDTILAVADKMGWSTGATGLFREALQTAHAAGGDIEAKPPVEPEPAPPTEEPVEIIKNDEGFQVLSLTKPKG